MNDDDQEKRVNQLFEELVSLIQGATDEQVLELLGNGNLNALILAIFDPSEKSNYPNLNEFLLAKKNRATLIALLRHVITQNYGLKGVNNKGSGFISPSYIQWFDDGVMFLQGKNKFEGLIGLYRNSGSLSYAISTRDVNPGEEMGPDYFEFVDINEFKVRAQQVPTRDISNLDEPIQQIEKLLSVQDNNEGKYQELLIKYPWVIGAEYKSVSRHTKLDDKNIPDFTGKRVRDNSRDIIEVKPPFTTMFRESGELNSDFNDAWNQTERYLDFAINEKDYLRRKGLNFDNPKGFLILGYNLSDKEIKQIRVKERMNPLIRVLTYNDLVVFMKQTVSFIRSLKEEDSNKDL